MSLQPVRDAPMTDKQVERLRILLSTYLDGSGQTKSGGLSYPGYRDFERCTAIALGGETTEDKGIYDVIVDVDDYDKPFGIDCKMAQERPRKRECSFMELSNSSAKFHAALKENGVSNWRADPERTGRISVGTVLSWHGMVSDEVDIDRSKYLVLERDKSWSTFRICCFDTSFLNRLDEVTWFESGRSIRGTVRIKGAEHLLWEHYLESGGQLKVHPPYSWADWITGDFQLEQPPRVSREERAEEYFSDLWKAAQD